MFYDEPEAVYSLFILNYKAITKSLDVTIATRAPGHQGLYTIYL